MTTIGLDLLDDLAEGARGLAVGAAESSFALTRDWAAAALADTAGVRVVAANELPAEAMCVAITLVGSTTALGEQLPAGDEPVRAVRALEQRLGARAEAIVALNLAAENALLPLITAALLDLPLVDGDGCGRVFPLVEQTTYALNGINPTPLALAGPGGELVVFEAPRLQPLLSPVVLACGGWGIAACYPMTAGDLARAVVPGTLSRLLTGARPGARRLCRGRIVSVESTTGHASELSLPSRPSSIVITETGRPHRLFRLAAHNEIVVAFADGAPVASAPDQLLMVAEPGGAVVDVDAARVDLEVSVLVVPAAPAWHTDVGRALAGPAALGFSW